MTNNRYEGFETAQDRERRAAENRQKVADHLAEERRKSYEARQRRDSVRTTEIILEGRERREGGGAPAVHAPFASPTGGDGGPGAPDLDAAQNQPHGSALSSPTGNAPDREEERYQREMEAYEQKRMAAWRDGTLWAFNETPPVKPKKNTATLLPY